MGHFNTNASGITLIVPTDRLLVIGNGSSPIDLSDALVMLKNGATTLNGSMTINGNFQATGTLADSSGDVGTAGQLLSSTATGTAWIDAPSGGGSNTDSQTLAFDASATTTQTTLTLQEAMG